jgi:hypothetical protein
MSFPRPAIYYPNKSEPVLPEELRPEVVLPEKYFQPPVIGKRLPEFYFRSHLNDLTTFTGLHAAAQVDEWFQPPVIRKRLPEFYVRHNLSDLMLTPDIFPTVGQLDQWFQPQTIGKRLPEFYFRSYLLDIPFSTDIFGVATPLDNWWQPTIFPQRPVVVLIGPRVDGGFASWAIISVEGTRLLLVI